MSPHPNILWVLHGDEIYGVKRAILSLMRGLRAAGWPVSALTVHGGETFDALLDEGHPVSSLNMPRLPGMQEARGTAGKLWQGARLLTRQFPLRRRILAELRRRPPDALHVLSANILPAAAWAARRAGTSSRQRSIPCFWEMTSVLSGGYGLDVNRRVYRAIIRKYQIHPLANSHSTAASLGAPALGVDILYLGVDPKRFDPFSVRPASRSEIEDSAPPDHAAGAPAAIPQDSIIFVVAARMDPAKGQAILLQGMLDVRDPRLHLVLVGGDLASQEVQRIRAIARHQGAPGGAGAEQRVHFVPFTNEPQRYLALADVVVSAGLIPESFGLSVVEAMMLGKPVLVHALGGPAETVIDGQCGWHVHDPSPEGFRQGIQRALADRARWPELGAAARKRALELFSLSVQVENYQRLVSPWISPAGDPQAAPSPPEILQHSSHPK